jgi:pteridine reductase
MLVGKVALITGAAKRIGANIAKHLHANGVNLVINYHNSIDAAHTLQNELQAQRPNSVVLVQADLSNVKQINKLAENAYNAWQRLDFLINNAAIFYPTPINKATENDWDKLFSLNLKTPFFLSQATAKYLSEHNGCIINLVDIYGEKTLKDHPIYSATKAGLIMLTKSLANDLGAKIRVNAIAPGAIMWPENNHESKIDELTKQRIISQAALKRSGSPDDIAKTVLFLLKDANYISGQIIKVDGGRNL